MDAAAVILNASIDWNSYPNISPVCVPPDGNIEDFLNQPATISGWGIKHGGQTADVLQKGTVTVLPPEQCSDASIYGDVFTPAMLCAGVPDGSVDTCSGDCGGPLGMIISGLL